LTHPFSDLLKQISRRSVGRVTIAYVVIGWLLAQVAEFATETFAAPQWVLRTFVVFLILGLPVAILLAWVFDLTPQGIRRTADTSPGEGENGAPARRAGQRAAFVAFILVTIAVAGWFQFYGPEPSREVMRPASSASAIVSGTTTPSLFYDLAFPADAPLALIGAAELGNGKPAFAISPSGRYVVYVGQTSPGVYQLYLRDLQTDSTVPLNGTDGAYHPFFAPNSAWIGFFVGNDLFKVHVSGSDPVFVSEATNSVGADWTTGDEIIVSIEEGQKIIGVPASGGPTRDVYTQSSVGYLSVANDHNKIFAGGKAIALESGQVIGLNIRSSDIRFINGYLFFAVQGTLFACRYDISNDEVTSNPVPVITGIRTEIWGVAQWSVSNDGTLVYMPGGDASANPMHWASPEQTIQLDLPKSNRGTMEISPDGKRIAVLESNGLDDDIWVYEVDDGRSTKLTTDGINWGPLFWAPDGLSVYHQKVMKEANRTYRSFLNSQRPAEAVLPDDVAQLAVSISRDGRFLGLSRAVGIGVYDVVDEKLNIVPTTSTDDWGTAISPDGRAVAYTSSATGAYHVFMQPLPPTGQLIQVSRKGGAEEPRWGPDGTKLYFRSGSRIMAVDVVMDPQLAVGQPRVFYAGVFENVSGRSYDIDPNEERALVIRSDDLAPSMRVVTNWFGRVEAIIRESEEVVGLSQWTE